MTDEEFELIKKQIVEVGVMCFQINSTFNELKKEISELDKSFSKLQSDVHYLKSDVNALEVF